MTHTHVHVHTYIHIYIPGPKLIWKSRAMWVRYSFLQKLVAIFCGPALKLRLSFLFCWKANCIIFKVFSQNYMHSIPWWNTACNWFRTMVRAHRRERCTGCAYSKSKRHFFGERAHTIPRTHFVEWNSYRNQTICKLNFPTFCVGIYL